MNTPILGISHYYSRIIKPIIVIRTYIDSNTILRRMSPTSSLFPIKILIQFLICTLYLELTGNAEMNNDPHQNKMHKRDIYSKIVACSYNVTTSCLWTTSSHETWIQTCLTHRMKIKHPSQESFQS